MNSSLELIERAKVQIKELAAINLATLKNKCGIGMVSANLLLKDLEELGVIKELENKKGVYEVIQKN